MLKVFLSHTFVCCVQGKRGKPGPQGEYGPKGMTGEKGYAGLDGPVGQKVCFHNF